MTSRDPLRGAGCYIDLDSQDIQRSITGRWSDLESLVFEREREWVKRVSEREEEEEVNVG